MVCGVKGNVTHAHNQAKAAAAAATAAAYTLGSYDGKATTGCQEFTARVIHVQYKFTWFLNIPSLQK